MTVTTPVIQPYAITGARVLTPEGWAEADVVVEGGHIAEIGTAPPGLARLEAAGTLLLPGIVDLHGDAFERHMAPRPGVGFPVDLALASNDAALIANGITTFFYSITDGFEPGPRSRDTARDLVQAVHSLRPRMGCDARIHVRHERVATEGHAELSEWLEQGMVHLLSLNDHLPPLDDPVKRERYLSGLRRRVPMTEAEEGAFLESLQDRRALGHEQCRELAAMAHAHGVALASHDDRTAEDVALAQALGVSVAEFPITDSACRAHRAAGVHVMMGAPNAVRGGSHVGGLGVREAVGQGLVDVLVSDYHYPSLLHVPFLLAGLGILPLERAWGLVSANPAAAAGLDDRGVIAPGRRADLLLMRGDAGGLPLDLLATIVGGRAVLRRP